MAAIVVDRLVDAADLWRERAVEAVLLHGRRMVGAMAAAVLLVAIGGATLVVTGLGGEATTAPETPTLPDLPPADPVDPPSAPIDPIEPTDPGDEDYAFLDERRGRPVGFDPCVEEIRVLYNPAGEPYGAAADLAATVRLLEAGMGRPVAYAGTTDRTEVFERSTIVVSWVARPADIDAEPEVVGQSSAQFGDGHIVASVINLVASGDLQPGLEAGGWGVTMLHELGHAVGLAHVQDRAEIMYPSVVPGRAAEWGDGDLNGLRQLAGVCRAR